MASRIELTTIAKGQFRDCADGDRSELVTRMKELATMESPEDASGVFRFRGGEGGELYTRAGRKKAFLFAVGKNSLTVLAILDQPDLEIEGAVE